MSPNDRQPLQKSESAGGGAGGSVGGTGGSVSGGSIRSAPTTPITPITPITPLPSEPLPRASICSEYGFYKFLSRFYTLLNVVLGLAAFVVGLWALNVQYEPISGASVMSPTAMTITISLVIIVTSPMGIVGVKGDKLLLLRCFLVVVVIVFVFQVCLGITAFVYREEVKSKVSGGAMVQLQQALQNYLIDEKVRDAVDSLQQRHRCCGLDDAIDWNKNPNYTCHNPDSFLSCSVPDSCCVSNYQDCGKGVRESSRDPTAKTYSTYGNWMDALGIYSTGCTAPFVIATELLLDVLGATSLAYAILHIVGIFAVYMLIVQLEDKEQLFRYRSRYYNP